MSKSKEAESAQDKVRISRLLPGAQWKEGSPGGTLWRCLTGFPQTLKHKNCHWSNNKSLQQQLMKSDLNILSFYYVTTGAGSWYILSLNVCVKHLLAAAQRVFVLVAFTFQAGKAEIKHSMKRVSSGRWLLPAVTKLVGHRGGQRLPECTVYLGFLGVLETLSGGLQRHPFS